MSILRTTIHSGKIRGLETATAGITVFKGIPYAAPTSGEGRWRAPSEPAPWTEERLCGDFGYSCWQRENKAYMDMLREKNPVPPRPLRMDEDCLSLNVWTPAKSAEDRLPVMVWFYGGGLQGGTSDDITFDGEGLCGYGVLLVTVNYRTGVFGYFGHEELEKENGHGTSGNYGLQDQLFALKWVNRNIAAFGGDPGNVTIFGCSGGGRSVQGIACSPMGRGLFAHAVCHSAGGLNPHYSLPYDEIKRLGRAFTEFCGAKSVAELRRVPAEELQRKYDEFRQQFNITADGYYLPHTMDEMVRRGEQADADYILSTMNDEIPIPPRENVTLESFEARRGRFGYRTAILGAVCHPLSDEEAYDVVKNAEAYEMKASQLAWARVQANQPKKPVYLCTFVHPVPGGDGGAHHGDDQFYVFHTLKKNWRPYDEKDEALSRRLMRYWTDFAKTGDPNGEGEKRWTPYTNESPLTFIFDTDGDRMEDRRNHIIDEVVDAYIDLKPEK